MRLLSSAPFLKSLSLLFVGTSALSLPKSTATLSNSDEKSFLCSSMSDSYDFMFLKYAVARSFAFAVGIDLLSTNPVAREIKRVVSV